MPPVPLQISLRYEGRDVDNGTMLIEDVAETLQGFSGAYAKVAARIDPNGQHQLRVSAIRPGSFDVLILAWLIFGQSPDQMQVLETATEAVKRVLRSIFGVIAGKTHTKGQPFDITVRGDNNVVIFNNDGAQLVVPRESFELFKERTIDSDLSKITAPLQPEFIDAARISATDGGETIEAVITSAEREYFRPLLSVATTQETEITGTLVSLNKERNRGTFKLPNGTNVPYHYIGENPDRFHVDFARRGAVRVVCVAHLDDNLTPTQLDIRSVRHLQAELPFVTE